MSIPAPVTNKRPSSNPSELKPSAPNPGPQATSGAGGRGPANGAAPPLRQDGYQAARSNGDAARPAAAGPRRPKSGAKSGGAFRTPPAAGPARAGAGTAAGLTPEARIQRALESVNAPPEQRAAVLKELAETPPEELGRALSLATPEARRTVLEQMAPSGLGTNLRKALDTMDPTRRAELLRDVQAGGTEGTKSLLRQYVQESPKAAGEALGAAARAMKPAELAGMVAGFEEAALGQALGSMSGRDSTSLLDAVGAAGSKPAKQKLFAALDTLPDAKKAQVLAPAVERGKSTDSENGRSVARDYFNQPKGTGQAAANKVLAAAGEKAEAFRDLIRSEVHPSISEAVLQPQGEVRRYAVDTAVNLLKAGLDVNAQLLALNPVTAISLNPLPAVVGNIPLLLNPLNLSPAELDQALSQVYEDPRLGSNLKMAFAQAPDGALKNFGEFVAQKGGPQSKAIGLELLTGELDISDRDGRETTLGKAMTEIVKSGNGNVLASKRPEGTETVSRAIEEMLRGDAPPHAGVLTQMTSGLGVMRAIEMDQALKRGYESYLRDETDGGVGLDILSSFKIKGDVPLGDLKLQVDLDIAKIAHDENKRKAACTAQEFVQYLASYQKRFAEDPRSQHLYEQKLDEADSTARTTSRMGLSEDTK